MEAANLYQWDNLSVLAYAQTCICAARRSLPSYFHFHGMCVHICSRLPLVHSRSCLCWPLSADQWQQTAHDSSLLLGGPLSPAGGKDGNAYHTMFHARPSLTDALNSPGSLSSAALSLSPCGRSPVPSQRCFALLGLAPDIFESSAQTVQPALSARPDSLPCSDTQLLGLKTSQCLSANSSTSKTTVMC